MTNRVKWRRGFGMQDRWTAVDLYFGRMLIPADPVLESALQASRSAGLPAIQVAPNQAKLLWILARMLNARKILEIGTLGGYSTIWLARAMPAGGRLITLEADPGHAVVARENVARAGLSGVVEVRVGRALDLLPGIAAERARPFDLVFIDADKANNPEYFAWALKLTRQGSLIVVDNVVRNGAVAEPNSTDPGVIGTRRFLELAAAEPRVSATAIQTVGEKGYDGFAVALVVADP
jgi:predicted O-methyltransferase YrrM